MHKTWETWNQARFLSGIKMYCVCLLFLVSKFLTTLILGKSENRTNSSSSPSSNSLEYVVKRLEGLVLISFFEPL